MSRRNVRLLLLATLPALAAGSLPVPNAVATEPARTYVVLLRSATPDAGVARAEALGGSVSRVYRYAVRGYAAALPPSAVDALRADPDVSLITPSTVLTVQSTQPDPTWGLDRIDQRALPLDSAYTYGPTGAGVTAYVIDSGIRTTHVEFGGRAVSGFDAVDGGTADDCLGHGTHVAGTIGGATFGVAKDVTLVAVRVIGCGISADTATVVAGVDWVTQDHLLNRTGPAVANVSIGGNIPAPDVDAAVAGSIAAGISYAVSAGNNGTYTGACQSSPGHVPQAMTVGSTGIDDHTLKSSSYGPCVDWYAPGGNVESASALSDTATELKSGTSMATPHTAGVAAQYLELHPGALPHEVHQALGDRTTKNVVTTTEEDGTITIRSASGPEIPPRIAPTNDDLLFAF